MTAPQDDSEAGERLSRGRIEQRFVANSVLILGARVATSALSLATIPVVVSGVGIAGYGSWEALLAVASLTSVIQASISGTLVWRISDAYGRGDLAEIRRLGRLGAGASWALLLLLWPVAWLVREPIAQFLQVPIETRHVVSQVFPIVVALALLNGFSETLEAVVSGCQRTGLVNLVAAVGQILNYSVVIVMALLGGGIWSLVAGQSVGFIGRFVGGVIATRATYGPISLVPLVPNRNDLSMARYSALLTVGSVAAVLRDQTDKIILASLASPVWVAYYGIAARLSSVVMEIIRLFYVPLLTAVGALNAIGDWEGVRRIYARVMSVVSVVTGVLLVVLAGLTENLVVLWIGYPIPEVTMLLWFLILGSATAAMLTGPGTALCRGCGRVEIETTYLMLNLALNLVLTIVMVLAIGAVGTAVATGTTWAISSVVFVFVLHRNLDLPVVATQRAAAVAVLATVVAISVHWVLSLVGIPQGRGEALGTATLLGSAGLITYLGLLASFGLLSIPNVYEGFRSALRRARSPA